MKISFNFAMSTKKIVKNIKQIKKNNEKRQFFMPTKKNEKIFLSNIEAFKLVGIGKWIYGNLYLFLVLSDWKGKGNGNKNIKSLE